MKPVEKRRGRPTKSVEPGERASLGLRVTPEIKTALEAAAAKSGRSQSQEAEFRLERSFREEELFSSRETFIWAILHADQFTKAGKDEARRHGLPDDDKTWMASPDCLMSASYAVMSNLVNELARMKGSDPEMIGLYIDRLKSHLAHMMVAPGRAKWVDKDGNPLVGFITKSEE